jgi:hypothetical protein
VGEARSVSFPPFWKLYSELPEAVRKLADKQFALFQDNPRHPSLGFAKKGEVYTVDVGRSYRAMARREGDVYYWFWIGSHEAYNKLLNRTR